MEFEPDAPVTDEARLLAQTRKLTLQPADPFLKPEKLNDPVIINETHANVQPDTEDTADTSRLIRPSNGMQPPSHKFHQTLPGKVALLIISLLFGLSVGAGAFLFMS